MTSKIASDELLDELFSIGNLTDEQYRQVKRLRAEVQRLRAVLAEMLESFTEPEDDNDILRRARAALGKP